MTQDEIIEMARQAGLGIGVALDGSKSAGRQEDKSFVVGRLPLEDFEAFAKLVAAKEREACAKLIKSYGETLANGAMLADLIRARGEQT